MDKEKLVKLINVKDAVEAQMIEDLLITEDIHCDKQFVGSGQYLNIYMGVSMSGIDLYVWEHDFEKAYDLVKAFFSGEMIDNGEVE